MHRIEIENTRQTYLCAAENDLLRGMERLGGKGIPAGCRGGGCGICKVQILTGSWRCGKMSTAVLTPEERRRGIVLACRCYPESGLVLKVIGKMKYRLEKFSDG
ncbi:2Fe-2S iron-sulfur cluster binding domain-containing protein [Enterobacillus tribolii]|uniref:Ferredoxin n=1 Tax=Enterobacillus tribolii TaxID=1487935 RepID=A0A370Q726_9GAMM|nr:2Fe-2S iron-sulfur cluster binding domain-containing protein [Enterobacillus tribolii]MBW7984935.1 2Fe-2S iron-sulfur cluster binding domain-containing protein [Enterobacillus tribolii]RDK84147.1 ferredoxin [Enterobacillus tribolii]